MDSSRNGRQPEGPSFFKQFWGFAQTAILVYFASQWIGGFLSKQIISNPSAPPESVQSSSFQSSEGPAIPDAAVPLWPLGTSLDLHVYISNLQSPLDLFSDQQLERTKNTPGFVWRDIILGDWADSSRFIDIDIKIPHDVQMNRSLLFAHIFVVKDHGSPNPSMSDFDPRSVHYLRKVLTRLLPKSKVRKEKNLLSTSDEAEIETEEPDVMALHWHSNLTLTLVSDNPTIPYSKLPPALTQYAKLVPEHRRTAGQGVYWPILFTNDFWQLRSQFIEVNSTTSSLPLHITFYPISYMKFQVYASLTAGFEEAAKNNQQAGSAELDELKRMLTETNPYLLILTAVVSVLHMVFEFLAFSSDVSHWRNKKELTGVSVRTIITNVFAQLVILLYLFDNNAETSWMILMGQGMGILIETWKITKAVDIKFIPATSGSFIPYRVEVHDKHVLSEDEKKTQEYDREAFRYVAYVAIPLLLAYTIYSLVYETHRGWYSFTISTLTSFVYMFGFAQLIPQLIINYKLKSVSHMPMKAMIYKTLGTVIDDLFAFCIKMPLLHRLACFRDDVVFLIFLYQRYIYRVDHTRVNEFGQGGETESDKLETKKNK